MTDLRKSGHPGISSKRIASRLRRSCHENKTSALQEREAPSIFRPLSQAPAMSIVINILLVFEVLICLLLILLVLMQRPKNEGLGAAFGGGMTDNLFGAQTTNVLQTLTRNLGIGFFIISAALGWLSIRQSMGKSNFDKELGTAPVPAVATPAPAPGDATSLPVELPAVPASAPTEKKPDPANPAEPAPAPAPEPKPGTDTNKPSPEPSGAAPAPAPAATPANSETEPAEPAPAPEPPKPAEPAKE